MVSLPANALQCAAGALFAEKGLQLVQWAAYLWADGRARTLALARDGLVAGLALVAVGIAVLATDWIVDLHAAAASLSRTMQVGP